MKLDHFAYGVHDFDARTAFFVDVLGLQLLRIGERHATGTKIAMLADEDRRNKIELIEVAGDEPEGFIHMALRVEDVDAAYGALLEKGLISKRPPHDLTAAKARTALLEDSSGLSIQIIAYAPDSPDL
jgi:catechol 2,3-dioxygenase-like lactoylglutathione lyase family enzyme